MANLWFNKFLFKRSHQFERNSEVAIPREHEGNMHAMPTIQGKFITLIINYAMLRFLEK